MRVFPTLVPALVLAAAALLAPRASAEPPGAAPAAEPVAKAPEEGTRAEVIRIVDELREEVAKVRGLAWKQKVPADLLSREQLKERLAKMAKEDLDAEEYARAVKILRRLGMLKEGEDPLEMELKFLEAGIAGYYDPKTKRLYVIDGLSGEGQRPTIFHELIHALDDQYLDLEKETDAREKDADALFAFKCAIEGCAEHGRQLYERANPAVAARSRQEQASTEKILEQKKMLDAAPAYLLLPTLLNYQTGPRFVGRFVGADYPGGMTRLYADVPVSAEQVLHPEKYLGAARDLPQRVAWGGDLAAAAGEGWAKSDEDTVGELDFALWINHFLGGREGRLNLAGYAQGRWCEKVVRRAAEGWDGMWVQVLEKGPTIALAIASAWDTPEDAAEAGGAMVGALQVRHGAAWRGGDWKDGEGGLRTADFEGVHGPGRVAVRGPAALFLEGLPAASFETAWAALAKTTFAKDPKDAWDPTTRADPLAAAAWRDEKAGIGWVSPGEGWTVEANASNARAARLSKGATALRVEAKSGELMAHVLPWVAAVKRRYPAFNLQKHVEETDVSGRTTLRVGFETPAAAGAAASTHVMYLVGGFEGATLYAEADAPTGAWDAARKDVEAAIEGFVARD
jgi:hypothetical protein